MSEPTHANLHRDIGGLKVDVANVKEDVVEIKKTVRDGFSEIKAQLQTLLDERQQRIGIRKFAAIIYTVGGSTLTLVAQWALKKIGVI